MNQFFYLSSPRFCLSATYITHFTNKNVADIGNVTEQASIFEHDLLYNDIQTCDTSSPLPMISLSASALFEPDCTSSLKRSPVERWQNPYLSIILAHWVPFPDPGPPEKNWEKFNNQIIGSKCAIQPGEFLNQLLLGMYYLITKMCTHIYTKILKIYSHIYSKILKM